MRFDGAPEELAKALFARARPADPEKQVSKKRQTKN